MWVAHPALPLFHSYVTNTMKKSGSLYTALLRNYILIGVVPLLVLGVVCQQLLFRNLTKEITSKNHLLAVSVAGDMRTFFQEPLLLLHQVETLRSTQAQFSSATLTPYLNAVINNSPFLEKIQYLNNDGRVVLEAPFAEAPILEDTSSLPAFQAMRKKKGPFWSPTFISTQSGAPSMTISIPFDHGSQVI